MGQTASFRPPVVLAAGPSETFQTVSYLLDFIHLEVKG